MAETVWTLNDVAPTTIGQAFDPAASESTAVYWGGPSSMAFAAATGDATALPTGILSTSAIGTVTAAGAALVLTSGVSSTSAIGDPVASGPAMIVPAGIQTFSAIGATSSGEPTDIVNTAGGGRILRPYRIHDVALVEGVSSRSAIGQPIVHGDGVAQPTGIDSRSAIGIATVGIVAPLVSVPRSASGIGQVQAVAVYRQPAVAYTPAERSAVAHPTVPLTLSRMGYACAYVARPTADDLDLFALLDEVAA